MPLTKRWRLWGFCLTTMFYVSNTFAAVDTVKDAPQMPNTDTPALSGLNVEQFMDNDHEVNWQNNPFAENPNNLDISSLKLRAIIHDRNEAAALINQYIVKVGDKIGSAEIVSISPKEVILRTDEGILKLEFEGKPNVSK